MAISEVHGIVYPIFRHAQLCYYVVFCDRSCPSSFADAKAAKSQFIGAALNLSNCYVAATYCYC